MDDKEKSVVARIIDSVSDAVGNIAKAAVTPTVDPHPEAVAEKTNEQTLLRGDAAIAPEAIPAPTPKKRAATKRANKRVAETARTVKAPAKKANEAAAKKSDKKASKKSAKKTVKKRVLKKSPAPVRKNRSTKARKKA